MVILFINSKELLVGPNLVINLKKIIKHLNVIKMVDTTWISCDCLHVWLLTQSPFIDMVSSSIARR